MQIDNDSIKKLFFTLIIITIFNIILTSLYQGYSSSKNRSSKCITKLAECDIIPGNKSLKESYTLARDYIKNNQKPGGNFNYEYSLLSGTYTDRDDQFALAETLHDLVMTYKHTNDPELSKMIEKTFKFFEIISRDIPNEKKAITFTEENYGKTSVLSLVLGALIEYYEIFIKNEKKIPPKMKSDIYRFYNTLAGLKKQNGDFHESYSIFSGAGIGQSSPQNASIALYAIIKYYKYSKRQMVLELAEQVFNRIYTSYLSESFTRNMITFGTVQSFKWGAPAIYELSRTHKSRCRVYEKYLIRYVLWLAEVYCLPGQENNINFSLPGVIYAHRVSLLRGGNDILKKIECLLNISLRKMISWQVGHSSENSYLKNITMHKDKCIGGVLNIDMGSLVRINFASRQLLSAAMAEFTNKEN